MTTLTKVLVGLLLATLAVAGVQTWRVRAATRAGAETAVAPAKAIAAEAKARVDTVTVHLAGAERTVTRELTRVRTDTLMLAPQSPQDTAKALGQLPVLATSYDSLHRACREYVDACTLYRAAAVTRFRADSVVIAKQGAWIDAGLVPRRWSLGVTAGYGAMINAGHVYTGPSLTAGLSWRVF
jgi:hypothetical protein